MNNSYEINNYWDHSTKCQNYIKLAKIKYHISKIYLILNAFNHWVIISLIFSIFIHEITVSKYKVDTNMVYNTLNYW